MIGIIIKNTGSWYTVRTDDGQLLQCKVKGNFRLRGIRSTNPVAVGDRVVVQDTGMNSEPGTRNSELETRNSKSVGLITEILDRKNYIIRRASNLSKQSHILAANVDQVLLVVTIAHPETSTTFIDRFLATAEAYRVPVILIFNKSDIFDEIDKKRTSELISLYSRLGYECVVCSALTGQGIEPLSQLLRDKTTLVSGNSGVGKSTLLNALIPGLDVETAEISQAHDTGQHTTTFSAMYGLPLGGWLIDTPGIKGFGTFDIEREELSHYFREIFRESEGCRFDNCTHTHEPACAVLQAVEEGRIALTRYASYLNMLDDKNEEKYRKGY